MTDTDSILTALQMLRLKGRVAAQDFAPGNPGLSADLLAKGWVQEVKGNLKITSVGRGRVAELVEAERAGLDAAEVAQCYEAFTALNADFKDLVTCWQIRDGAPNDHGDAAYDAAVIDRLVLVHSRLLPFLERVIRVVPRLAHYVERFQAALARVQAGEHAWLARPIIDSYHTVWFELHEELIGLAGHTREAEAAAGRAA